MADRQNLNGPARSGADTSDVDALAGRAIRMVASQGRLATSGLQQSNIAALQTAALSGGRDECLEVVERLIAGGVSRETISDVYIPEIARSLGREWCEDTKSFAEVTLGVSRLQSLLRELGPEWRADHMADPNSGSAMIVVALDEFHTLGAVVLAGRLRREGVSVKLQMGLAAEDLRKSVELPRFDAVLISASQGENLETLRSLVEAVRNSGSSDMPVVIGGSILETDQDIRALTGADFVTSDPVEALELCGLKIATRADAPLVPAT